MGRRVLHLVEYLYQGGIERLLEQMAKHTPEQSASLCFYAYQTKSLEGIAGELKKSGVPLYIYDKPAGYDFQLLKNLVDVVKKHQIQTIHTHDFGPMEYAVALKLRFPRLQLVHTHHSLHYFFRFPKYVRLFQLFSLFYSRIICVSDFVREQLSERCPLAKRKLVTVYNGVDLRAFSGAPARLPQGLLRLVNVSRISPEKNLTHVLKACHALKEAGVDFVFHHAGSGEPEEEKRLREFVVAHGLSDQVRFHGFLSDIRPILDLGDIFVSPSTTEGHPVAVLEAMASGKLCLCSDIRPHRLLSREGLLFFNLDDDSLVAQLKAIAKKPAAYLELGKKARGEVSKRFSLERMICDYSAIYQGLTLQA